MTHNKRNILEDWNGKHNFVSAGKPEAGNGPVSGHKLERGSKGSNTEKNHSFGEIQGICEREQTDRSRRAQTWQGSERKSNAQAQITLVIDANILFSALIKDSITAELLFDERLRLYAPEFLIDEFMKYEELILEKTRRTREDFVKIMKIIPDIIRVIPKNNYLRLISKAIKISPDENDAHYFALALKLNCGIWSNDKKLKEQAEVKVHSTVELGIILGINPQ